MIQRLYIDNYKCLVNFEIHFDELNLLMGPNGVGKSAILEVIVALQKLLSGKSALSDEDIFPSRTRTRWQDVLLQTFEMDVVLHGLALKYRLVVEHEKASGNARVKEERIAENGKFLFNCDTGTVQLYRNNHLKGPTYTTNWHESALARVPPDSKEDDSGNGKLTQFLEYVRKIQICQIDPRRFLLESRSEDSLLCLDGSNFASWYRYMLQEHPEFAFGYFNDLKKIQEGFQSIRLAEVGEETRSFKIKIEKNSKQYELRLDELSDGQRILLTNYALLHMLKNQGRCVIIDEPSNFVALPEIQPWLMELNDCCGESGNQAILCSHHPELVNYLGPDKGQWLKKEVSGHTVTQKISFDSDQAHLDLSEIIARYWMQ